MQHNGQAFPSGRLNVFLYPTLNVVKICTPTYGITHTQTLRLFRIRISKWNMVVQTPDLSSPVLTNRFWKVHWVSTRTGTGLDSHLSRAQTMVSRNNAADEMLSKENTGLTSWVLKSHSWANTLLPQSALSEFPLPRGKRDHERGVGCEYYHSAG